MKDHINKDIFKLCYAIDKIAVELYTNFSLLCENKELKFFWEDMSQEEKEHVGFWTELLELSKQNIVPQMFENPEEIKKYLKDIKSKSSALLKNSVKLRRKSDMFLSALSMEFLLLHPAFFTLFNFAKNAGDKDTPKETYDQHLDKLLNALVKYRKEISELSFVGELLDNVLKENKKLSIQGQMDPLTEITNRRGFFELIKPLAYLAKRHKLNIGIMMIDIDNFKRVNDEFGHTTGDDTLKHVAKIMKDSIRVSDIIGRYGGEEFIIFFSHIAPNSVYKLCEKLRLHVEKSTAKKIPITISIGVCYKIIESTPEDEIQLLIKKSDECLYIAKKKGKNCIVISDMSSKTKIKKKRIKINN